MLWIERHVFPTTVFSGQLCRPWRHNKWTFIKKPQKAQLWNTGNNNHRLWYWVMKVSPQATATLSEGRKGKFLYSDLTVNHDFFFLFLWVFCVIKYFIYCSFWHLWLHRRCSMTCVYSACVEAQYRVQVTCVLKAAWLSRPWCEGREALWSQH